MNITALFSALRLMAGKLSQSQVDSVNAILEACTKHGVTDVHQIAYIIATAWHESRLKPIREIGLGKGHKYGVSINGNVYYGRGFVQLTWKDNYQTFSKILGVDLVDNPDLALQTDYAAEIIVVGMKNGLFTGKRLSNYFTGTSNDSVSARRIVNGLDCASLISGYYKHVLDALIS